MNEKEQVRSFVGTNLEDTRRQFVKPTLGIAPDSDLRAATQKATKTVVICETQPVAAEGLRTLLEASPNLRYQQTLDSLTWALDVVRSKPADLLVVDKTFGIRAILEWLRELGLTEARSNVVIWGASFTEAEAHRLFQAGARGILRKTARAKEVLSCLLDVAEGRNWIEDPSLQGPARSVRPSEHGLTAREQQVLDRVERGLRNREIAKDLGITLGTVKIHLNHIFIKTGARTRHELAPGGLKGRGPVSTTTG